MDEISGRMNGKLTDAIDNIFEQLVHTNYTIGVVSVDIAFFKTILSRLRDRKVPDVVLNRLQFFIGDEEYSYRDIDAL